MIFQAVLWLPGLCIVDKMCCPIAVTFRRDTVVFPGTHHLHLINEQCTVHLVAHRPVQLIWNARYLRLCCIAFFLIAELDRVQSDEIVKEGEQLRKHYQGSISTFAQRKGAMEDDSICFLKAWNTSWLHQTRRNACQWGMAACSQPSDMQNIWEDSDSEGKWDCWWRCKPGWNPNFIRAHVFVLKVTWWIWQRLDRARAIWMVCFSDSRPCQQEFVSNMFAILGCIRRSATRFARLTMPSLCWFQLAFHRQLYVALIYI